MSAQPSAGEKKALLAQVEFGPHGLTRHDLRAQVPALPDVVFLHLPDSKHFYSAAEILHEVRIAPARAEGEFIALADAAIPGQALADDGPSGFGPSPLIAHGYEGGGVNHALPGFDGNSLETAHEFDA